jgi:hypothetical protein
VLMHGINLKRGMDEKEEKKRTWSLALPVKLPMAD